MAANGTIRVKSVCVFRRDGRVLLEKGYNPSTRQSYYVPPGGAVEFGERTAEAIAREIREEFQADIKGTTLLGVCESFFVWDNKRIHEIVFVFDAQFADNSLYEAPIVRGHEAGMGPIEAFWLPLADLRSQPLPVYPDGLLDMLVPRNKSV